jgi:hypothetical protein
MVTYLNFLFLMPTNDVLPIGFSCAGLMYLSQFIEKVGGKLPKRRVSVCDASAKYQLSHMSSLLRFVYILQPLFFFLYACVDFVGFMLARSASSFLKAYVDFSEHWLDIAHVRLQLLSP